MPGLQIDSFFYFAQGLCMVLTQSSEAHSASEQLQGGKKKRKKKNRRVNKCPDTQSGHHCGFVTAP